jgi:hypothetical protein
LAAGVGGNRSVVPSEKATRKAARDEGGDQAQMQERQESEAAKTAATDRQPEEKVGQPPAKPVQENEVKVDKPATSASDQQPSFAEREAAVLKLLGEQLHSARRKVGVLCRTAEASYFARLAATLFPAFDFLIRTDAAGEIDFI